MLFFVDEAVEFGVVAGGDDESVYRPAESVNVNDSVLDDAEINLDKVNLVFKNFVAEMNTAAAYSGQRAPAQVEAIGVVWIGDMQQALDRFLAEQLFFSKEPSC